MEKDPIIRLEKIAKEIHDDVSKSTRPVLKRYPLLFALLITFGASAIIHGFAILSDQIEIFDKHPVLLILTGVIVLTLAGSLYKTLGKADFE